MSKPSRVADMFVIGFVASIFLIIILTVFIGELYEYDDISMQEFGQMMCAEHGLKLDHYKVNNHIPKVYCRQVQEIEDGYLIFSGYNDLGKEEVESNWIGGEQ